MELQGTLNIPKNLEEKRKGVGGLILLFQNVLKTTVIMQYQHKDRHTQINGKELRVQK